jgi:hypothetical protein
MDLAIHWLRGLFWIIIIMGVFILLWLIEIAYVLRNIYNELSKMNRR